MRYHATRSAACLLVFVSAAMAAPDSQRATKLDERLERGVNETHARTNYLWPFDRGPEYMPLTPGANKVRLVVGSIELDRVAETFPEELLAAHKRDDGGLRYWIVRTHRGVAPATVEIVARLSAVDWIVRSPGPLASAERFAAVSPYHPAFKLHPKIGRTPLFDAARAVSETYRLEVLLWPGELPDPVARRVGEMGGAVRSRFGDRLSIDLHRDALFDLARIEAVRLIVEDVPTRLHGGMAVSRVQTGGSSVHEERPYNDAGIRGAGQVLLVIDSGIQLDAADLADSALLPGTAGPAHRKVRRYWTADEYGGAGDLIGCDDPTRGGTHGHFVAAQALGNASALGQEDTVVDGFAYSLDGIAPDALLVALDAQVTPFLGPCETSELDSVTAGDLYDGLGSGALEDAHASDGARVTLLAWGSPGGVYTPDAIDVDEFLVTHPDALVFAATGQDPSSSMSSPATAKNALSFLFYPHYSGGTGPAPGGRVAPLLTATQGLTSFNCATTDDDQNAPVECLPETQQGSSSATAIAAGAGLLVRDYFALGFYPDGTSSNPGNAADAVPNVSGPLVKALFVNSAYLYPLTRDLTRHVNGLGYGEITLSRTLPLQTWPDSPTGLVVADGGIPGGVNDLAGLTGSIDAMAVGSESTTFAICDASQQLRVSLAWNDEVDAGLTGALVNDLDLELVSPSAALFRGNYFTDDDDRDGIVDTATEDCPGTAGAWSLAACTRADATDSPTDTAHPTEAVMLSPEGDFPTETGTWTLTVRSAGTGLESVQPYAVVVSGGLCGGSAVALDRSSYACNDPIGVTVIETAQAGDNALTSAEVATRLRVEVHDAGGLVDCEGAGCPAAGSTLAIAKLDPAVDNYTVDGLLATSGTARDPGNGVLDVRAGDRIVAIYADESGGVPDANLERRSEAVVDCSVDVALSKWGQWGEDTTTKLLGGCERSARGRFEYEFPDRYLDADEHVTLLFASRVLGEDRPDNVHAKLRCVEIDDVNAPEDCFPGTDACPDPERSGNPPCDPAYLTIVDPERDFSTGFSYPGVSFNIVMGGDAAIPDEHEVEFVLELTAPDNGQTGPRVIVSRQTLDADEQSFYYSTDFPQGGTQFVDYTGNESIEDPSQSSDRDLDYRFETRTWSDLTASGTKNTGLQSPWNFDLSDGGFRSGVGHGTDVENMPAVLTQWGEDLNFNGMQDGYCSLRKCSNNPAQNCSNDTQCGTGNTCDGVPQGFCEVASATQCGTDADCPPGDRCELYECHATTDCQGSGLSGLIRCVSPVEDRDPKNWALDTGGYSTAGGCGWQTLAPGTCSVTVTSCYDDTDCPAVETCNLAAPQATGGIWHTGTISAPSPTCDVAAATLDCELHDVIPGDADEFSWYELLLTPEIERVNGPDYQVEILDWAWNAAIQVDQFTAVTWDLDPDTTVNDLFDRSPLGSVWDTDPINSSNGQRFDLGGYPVFAPAQSLNGTLGENRGGQNGCYFDFNDFASSVLDELKLAEPADDDLNNGSCPGSSGTACTAFCDAGANVGMRCNDVAGDTDCPGGDCRADDPVQSRNDCDVTETCVGSTCSVSGASCGVDADCYTCTFANSMIDEFVLANGPRRNFSVLGVSYLDRFTPLADVLGTAGERFQAAVGLITLQSYDSGVPAAPGYGLGVDDMVLEWREVTLVPDATDCAMGSCATIDVSASHDGLEGQLRIAVTDASPTVNDCNGDGDTIDAGVDDTDCDDDGTPDVRVLAASDREPAGEWVTLNAFASTVFRGTLPYSVLDAAGVLSALGPVTVEYIDRDDGTGQPCAFTDGFETIPSSTIVDFVDLRLSAGDVPRLSGVTLRDNGDDDGWADTGETVEMTVHLMNPGTTDLAGVVAFASVSDPNIDCLIDASAIVGDIPAGETRSSVTPIRFRVSGVDRDTLGLSVHESLKATIDLHIRADSAPLSESLQSVELELDLDATGTFTPTAFFEGFETNTFGAFGDLQNIDQNLNSLVAADGYRCQYNDPADPASYTFEDADCYPGIDQAHADRTWWQIAGPGSIDGGRAFSGTHSLYFGEEVNATVLFTTPTGVIEAIATDPPIDLGWGRVCETTRTVACNDDTDCPANEACVSTSPILSLKHQVSFQIGTFIDTSGDGGVIQVQEADASGAGVGDWTTVRPFLNTYASTRENNYNICSFDPIDDGSDEDDVDYLDFAGRKHGPSSTCGTYELDGYTRIHNLFARQGDTDDSPSFFYEHLGNAKDGPALSGATGSGTWIETAVNLSEFRGKRLRLRFLVSSIKHSRTWQDAFNYTTADPYEDGWWIDDVEITDTAATAAALVPDTKDNSMLPGCGTCAASAGAASFDPPGFSAAPGQLFEIDAAGGTATPCSAVPMVRFWIDGDGNGQPGDPMDRLLRDWTVDSSLVQAPMATTDYIVEIGCPSEPSCSAWAVFTRQVACPTSSAVAFPAIMAPDKDTFSWTGPVDAFFAKGDLSTVSSLSVTQSGALGATSSLSTAADQPTGAQGFWYLLREDVAPGPECNSPGTWASGGPGEAPGRNSTLP